MSKTITIDEDKFIDILGSTSAKFYKTELDMLKFYFKNLRKVVT